jgi:hypothetical protein
MVIIPAAQLHAKAGLVINQGSIRTKNAIRGIGFRQFKSLVINTCQQFKLVIKIVINVGLCMVKFST